MSKRKFVSTSRKHHERGSLLLAIIIFILVVPLLFLLMTSMFSYRSQVKYELSKTSSFYAAHSAATNLIYELAQFDQGNSQGVDFGSTSTSVFDLKKRYETKPALPYFTDKFPETTITFDASKPYYSVDNSQSENPAKGWRDRGRSKMSVPPFCIDLIISVKARGFVNHYEAIINRKWPYGVYCEGGPIIVSRLGEAVDGKTATAEDITPTAPSTIRGSLFSTFDPRVMASTLGSAPGPAGVNNPYMGGPQASINDALFASIKVGSEYATVGDTGNKVIGDLYTSASDPGQSGGLPIPGISGMNYDPLAVKEKNTHQGKKHYGKTLPGAGSEEQMSFVKFPENLTGYDVIDPGSRPVMSGQDVSYEFETGAPGEGEEESDGKPGKKPPANSIDGILAAAMGKTSSAKKTQYSKTVSEYMDKAARDPQSLPPDLQKQIANAGSGSVSKIVSDYVCKNIYGYTCLLKKTLSLNGTGTSGKSRYYLKGDLINHWFKGKSEQVISAGVRLRDCTLYVDGDVDLSEFGSSSTGENTGNNKPSSKPSDNSFLPSKTLVSIWGNNSTLIVNGNLKLEGGQLNSEDKGMVIMARNMEFVTKGNFKGLVLAKGAIKIYPYPFASNQALPIQNQTQDCLKITGAVACSGVYNVKEDQSYGYLPNADAVNNYIKMTRTKGLYLRSVDLTFDPKYVKSLHRFGKPRIALWQEIN